MEPPALPADPVPTQDEKNLALIMHVLSLVGFSLLGPLIVWLVKKDESPFINAQGRELLNFQISFVIYSIACIPLCFILIGIPLLSFVIYSIACIPLCFILIGIPLLVVLGVAAFVLTLIGLVKATEGKIYRFPATIKIL